jgi:hypothetical protein
MLARLDASILGPDPGHDTRGIAGIEKKTVIGSRSKYDRWTFDIKTQS